MAFPLSPTNGQQYTANGVTWVYDSTVGAWEKQTTGSATLPMSVTAGLTVAGGITVTTGGLITSGTTTFNNDVTASQGLTVLSSGNLTSQSQVTISNALTSSTTTSGALLVTGGAGISGNVTSSRFQVGALSYSDNNILAYFQSAAGTYNQIILQNAQANPNASADIVVSNDIGTSSTYYGDFGMNSSTFNGSGSLNIPSAVYVTSTSSDLSLGSTTSNAIHFVINNGATDAMTIATSGNVTIPTTTTSTSSTTGALTVSGGVGVAGTMHVGGNVGFGVTDSTAFVDIGAGSLTQIPLQLASGPLNSTTTTGAVEYNGNLTFVNNTVNGRGYIPTVQFYRLGANTAAITTAATPIFGATSNVTLQSSSLYNFEYYLQSTKVTTGTTAFSMVFSQAPLWSAVGLEGSVGNVSTAASFTVYSLSVTASAAANPTQVLRLSGVVETNSANNGTVYLAANTAAGSITFLRGSYYKITKLPTNTGTFV